MPDSLLLLATPSLGLRRHDRITEVLSRQAAKRREILVVNPDPGVIERYRVILDVEVSQVGADFADFDPTTL